MSEFDEYLNALDGFLAPHLPAVLRQTRIDEIRSHLQMDLSDRVAAGFSSEEAARLARRALGSPQVLAKQMVRQACGYDSASPWKLTTYCGIGLLIGTLVPDYFWATTRGLYPWTEVAQHWLPFLALVYFGVVVGMTRRRLVVPMACWAALLFVGAFFVGRVPLSLTESEREDGIKGMNTQISREEKSLELVQAWKAGNVPLTRAPVVSQRPSFQRYRLPTIPIDIYRSIPTFNLVDVAPEDSHRLWALNGAAFEADRKQTISWIQQSIEQVNDPDSSSHFTLGTLLWLAGQWAALIMIYALMNWLVLAGAETWARWRTLRDPLLA